MVRRSHPMALLFALLTLALVSLIVGVFVWTNDPRPLKLEVEIHHSPPAALKLIDPLRLNP